jgi:hypothetical protein
MVSGQWSLHTIIGTLYVVGIVIIFVIAWKLFWPHSLDAVHSAAVVAVVIVSAVVDQFCPESMVTSVAEEYRGAAEASAITAIFAIMCHHFWLDSVSYLGAMSAAAAATAGVVIVILAAAFVIATAAAGINNIVRPKALLPKGASCFNHCNLRCDFMFSKIAAIECNVCRYIAGTWLTRRSSALSTSRGCSASRASTLISSTATRRPSRTTKCSAWSSRATGTSSACGY